MEEKEDKTARDFYYLGRAYYELGQKGMAMVNFYLSYSRDPESLWGIYSLRYYRFLTDRVSFTAAASLLYDSNVFSAPVPSASTLASTYLEAGFNFSPTLQIKYSFVNNSYFEDFASDSTHRGLIEVYTLFGKKSLVFEQGSADIPYYTAGRMSWEILNYGIRGEVYDYSEASGLDHRDSIVISGYYRKYFENSSLTLRSGLNRAKDLKEPFTYFYDTALPGQEHDFEEITSDESSFLPYSYYYSRLNFNSPLLKENYWDITLSGGLQGKIYYPEGRWYPLYWLKDPSDDTYYYLSGDEWMSSSQPPPGEAIRKTRKDLTCSLEISYVNYLTENLSLELFYSFSQNFSTFTERDYRNFNWQKNFGGLTLYLFI